MRSFCAPSLSPEPFEGKRAFITNTILYEHIIFDPLNAYIFYQTYPKVARDSVTVKIAEEQKSPVDCIIDHINSGFDTAAKEKMEPIDYWAMYIAMGGALGYAFLSRSLNEKKPAAILKRILEFYESNSVTTMKFPFYDELGKTIAQIDKKVGFPDLKLIRFAWFGILDKDKDISKLSIQGRCVADLAYSQLFSRLGYAWIPSHDICILKTYSEIFSEIGAQLRKDAKLNEAFKADSSAESLNYLLGEKVGQLNELLGFTPLNPLELVSKGITNEQIDEAVLKIRKDCAKVRKLFENVHEHCLRKQIQEAADAKAELANIQASQRINYSILDNTYEFMETRMRDAVHEYIDELIRNEKSSLVVKARRPLKQVNGKIGWISEVKFLTFGALLILASYGVDSAYLRTFFDALGSASLGSGAVGVVLRIIDEGIKLYPGFSIYGSFIDWPKIA